MNDYKMTLLRIQTAFYSDSICPAVFQDRQDPMKRSRYPGPKQTVFCSLLFPKEITDNPDPKLNTHSVWAHPGSLSLLMNGNIIEPSSGVFRNGFKRFHERTKLLFSDHTIIDLLIEQCETFLISNRYDYDNFCYFFNTELTENPSYFKPQITCLYQLTEKNPPAALAFFLMFALLNTDAVILIEQYLEKTAPTAAAAHFSSDYDGSECDGSKCDGSKYAGNEYLITECHGNEHRIAGYSDADKISIPATGKKKTENTEVLTASDAFEALFILPSSISNFCGRKKYLEVIHQLLHMPGEAHHLFLYGMSGIGKTELAKKYASVYQDYYDVILFLDYQGSLRRLICNDVLLTHCKRVYMNGKPESDENYFSRKIRVLWGISNEKVLLIIDNFNVTEEPALPELLRGNYCVLFTTQTDFSENGYRTLPVSSFEDFDSRETTAAASVNPVSAPFSMEELLEPGMTLTFFQQNYGRELPETEIPDVRRLISMFSGHLFVLELIARQMRVSRMTAGEMLDFLSQNGIYATKKLEKIRHYSSNAPQAVFEYVQHMVSSGNLTDSEQYILKNLALLPVSGVSDKKLKTWCELENYEVIEQLISKSLIRCDRDTGLLFLHPLIRELTLVNLHPCASDAETLIRNLALTVQNSWSKPRNQLDMYDTLVCSLLTNLDTFSENSLRCYEHLLEFCWQQGHFDLVIEKAEKAYDYCKRHRLDYAICGSIARAAGNCCYSRGIQSWADSSRWFCLMWHYYHAVEQGMNKEAAFAAQKIARSYLNQALYCNSSAEKALKRASDWNQQALDILSVLVIREKNSPLYSECQSYYGDAHYMSACISMYCHDNEKAYSETQAAISCYRFPDGRIRSASITAAKTLRAKLLILQKKFEEAAEELEESYQIELQLRGEENNSHLIRIYIARGDLYCYIGRIGQAILQYQEAARMIQQIYEPGNGRYFQEVSSKLLLCEHAQENKTLPVPITAGI